MSKKLKLTYLRYTIVFIICLGIDQISKLYFQGLLKSENSVSIISDFLELIYVENRGAAFGLFQGGMLFFALCSLVVVACLLYAVKKYEHRKYMVMLLAVVSAGAVGNMVDRCIHTYVIDFIHFSNLFGYSFPVFNVADIFLTCGLPLLLIDYIKHDQDKIKGEQ